MFWLYYMVTLPLVFLADTITLGFFGYSLTHFTILFTIMLASSSCSWKLLIPPLFLISMLSILTYDSFTFLLLFTFPLIIAARFMNSYFSLKMTTPLIFSGLWLIFYFFILPLFILKSPSLPHYTIQAFIGNIILSGLSLKYLSIVKR